ARAPRGARDVRGAVRALAALRARGRARAAAVDPDERPRAHAGGARAMSAAPSPFERPSAREIQRQRTRARLFAAALAEFARAGFDNASVAEIARAADVSRPSFYFHFPTKEHVLLELQWRKELDLVERLQGSHTLRELLAALPDAIADVYASIEGPGVARDMVMIYARLP